MRKSIHFRLSPNPSVPRRGQAAFLAVTLSLLALPSLAQQTSFSLAHDDEDTASLTYSFADADAVTRSIKLFVPTNLLNHPSTRFTPLSVVREEAQNRRLEIVKNGCVDIALRWASKLRCTRIIQKAGALDISYTHADDVSEEHAKIEIEAILDRAEREVIKILERNSFVIAQMFGEEYTRVDYEGVISRSLDALAPIAKQFRKHINAPSRREEIKQLLTFLQVIPYNELRQDARTNGSGFTTPLELLSKNIGDCDSKSVAFAGIMNHLWPSVSVIMVLVPEHAFVGIEIPADENDTTYQWNSRTYVLAEPGGPALRPLGQISPTASAPQLNGYETILELVTAASEAPLSAERMLSMPWVDFLKSSPPGNIAYRRGQMMEAQGKVDLALLAYETALKSGSAQAAMRLGRFYDPNGFELNPTPFTKPNAAKALGFYARAHEMGVAQALYQLSNLEAYLTTMNQEGDTNTAEALRRFKPSPP